MAQQFDCIVIGSGQAGTPLSGAFAKAGKKTALIERAHIGGCCVNEGCTPTKTMVASGRVAYLTRRGQDYGVHTDREGNGPNDVTVYMDKVRDRKRKIVESFRGGNERRVKVAGVEVFMGEGSFVDPKTIKVKMNDGSEKLLTSDLICINTGDRPARPNLPGVETLPPEIVLDSTSIMELDRVPEHLLVIGGGYIGLEFGQLFRRLGAKVTIIQRGPQLMPREDKDIVAALTDILKEDGIMIHLNTSAESIAASTTNGLELTIKHKSGGTERVTGSHILFAAGRVPNVEALNLAAAGVATSDKGNIQSNEQLETNVPGIYVLGDVKGGPAFTHISYDDFRILQANLLTNSSDPSKAKLTTANRIVPYVAYTDPQMGHVGLKEDEARKLYPNKTIKTAKMPMTYVARALETDETRGLMKAVVDADSGKILGFTCLGIEGGEIMSVVQMAMMGGVGYETLANAVWAHPSLAESLNNLWGFLE
ncbi:FAD/NAD(P)-binding domain-containing protein [Serendipita vermifera]|nr:FAD/NAD(P)-binding domain-containing protein [Serendipita vermifera]